MGPRWMNTACVSALVALSLACSGDSVTAPRRAVALDVVSGDKQTAPANAELPKPLVVRVTDANGQPVQGQIVNFRVTAGGGSMFAGAGSTNAQGIVQDRWTLGPAGPQTAEARAVDNTTGAAIVFATFTATAIDTATPPPPPPPTFGSFRVVSGDRQRAMVGTHLPAPVVFLVLDQTGQPLAGFTFTLRSLHCDPLNGGCPSTAGDDQLTNATLTTGTDGTAAFTGWTFSDVAGPKCLGFYPGTQPPRSVTDVGLLAVCAQALPGPLTRLVLLGGASPIPGNSSILDILVQAEDQFGNQIDGVTVTFTPSSGGSVSPTSDQTHTIPSSPYDAAHTTWYLGPGANTLTMAAGSVSLVITP
jgi:hypothetical protein